MDCEVKCFDIYFGTRATIFSFDEKHPLLPFFCHPVIFVVVVGQQQRLIRIWELPDGMSAKFSDFCTLARILI